MFTFYSHHSLGFRTRNIPYLFRFLRLQVVLRLTGTGTGVLLVHVYRNRFIYCDYGVSTLLKSIHLANGIIFGYLSLGYFCEENSVCLKPCPMGAYCIQNTLVSNYSIEW